MRRIAPWCVLVALAASPCFAFDLVVDGRPVAVIVTADAGASAKLAMRDSTVSAEKLSDKWCALVLADWIKKMTDAELPIVAAAPAGAPAIYIGQAALDKGLKIDVPSKTQEGLRIVADDQTILLAGQSPTATVKATCRLLEEMGCRYFVDHPLGEVYPRTRTLRVDRLDIVEKPGMGYRSIWGSRWYWPTLWKIWNGGGGTAYRAGHSWSNWVPPKMYDEHPEWFAGDDTRRRNNQWLCTSNPELRKYFADRVVEAVRGGAASLSISPPDGSSHCRCKACQALDAPNLREQNGQVSMSNRYALFYEYIAKRAAEVNPDCALCFYAYADYVTPPNLGRRLPDNLCAFVAPIRFCHYHSMGEEKCPSLQQLRQYLDGWSKLVRRIGFRTYNFNLTRLVIVPFSKLRTWKHDIPYLAAMGCEGIDFETWPGWANNGPHIYQGLRLAYDPKADSDKLMEDYWQKFYGKAAAGMKAYWQAIEDLDDNAPCRSDDTALYTPAVLADLQQKLDAAKASAAGDEKVLARIDRNQRSLTATRKLVAFLAALQSAQPAQAKTLYDDLVAELKANDWDYGKGFERLERFHGRQAALTGEAYNPPRKVLVDIEQGAWRYNLDADSKGGDEGFYRADFDDSAWATLKQYAAEHQGAFPGKERVQSWYRASFDLPGKTEGKVFLYVLGMNGKGYVWVNGQPCKDGDSATRRGPLAQDITAWVHPGRNVVAVRNTPAYFGKVLVVQTGQ